MAIFSAILVISTQAGIQGFVETRGMFDSVSLVLLLMAMYFRNPVIIASAIFLAAWNDERGLIAGSFVFLFYFFQNTNRNIYSSLLHALKSLPIIGLISGVLLYVITRAAYSYLYAIPLSTGGIGIDVLLRQINMIPISVWTMYEGGWIIILATLYILLQQNRYFDGMLFLGSLGVVLIVSLSVVDIGRSVAYGLPGVFVGLTIVRQHISKSSIKNIIITSTLLSFLWPAYYIGGMKTIWWSYPLPLQIARWIFLT